MVKCNDRGRENQRWWPELQFYGREYKKGTLREWKEESERKTKRVENMGKQESGGAGHACTASSRKLRQEGR